MGFIGRIRFWMNADRIGPDIPTSYWKLFFPSTMRRLCKKKFKRFADSAEFRPGAYATGCSRISLGKRVVVRPLSFIHTDASTDGADVVIEDDVMLAPGVHVYTNNHAFSNTALSPIDQGYDEVGEIVLKKGCWIGAHVVILPGVTIGEGAVVGAGSVVTKDIPAHTVAVGSPARVIKDFSQGSKE